MISFTRPFLLGSAFFQTTLPRSGGLSLERDEMPLHDAVGVNSKKSTTNENQGAGAWYMGLGAMCGNNDVWA